MWKSIDEPSTPSFEPCMRAVSVRNADCADGASFFHTSHAAGPFTYAAYVTNRRSRLAGSESI